MKKDMMKKKAKKMALKDMKKKMKSMMTEGMEMPAMKMTVASDSLEGMAEGMDKAQEIMDKYMDEGDPSPRQVAESYQKKEATEKKTKA